METTNSLLTSASISKDLIRVWFLKTKIAQKNNAYYSRDVNSFKSFLHLTALMVEQLTRMPREREVESLNPKSRSNLTQPCKQFVTASTSTQVAVLPWRYDAEMGTANSLHTSA